MFQTIFLFGKIFFYIAVMFKSRFSWPLNSIQILLQVSVARYNILLCLYLQVNHLINMNYITTITILKKTSCFTCIFDDYFVSSCVVVSSTEIEYIIISTFTSSCADRSPNRDHNIIFL